MQKKLFFTLVISFLSYFLNAQDYGSPFIVNYTPKEYNGHAQVWSITDDNQGLIYFGTTTGIIQFDGVYWRSINLPQVSNVRSLFKSSTGIIYVGGTNEFGYLNADSIGAIKYFSLVNLLDSADNKFADVWEIYENEDGIFFRSTQKLFRYNEKTEKVKTWAPKQRFNPISFIPGIGIIVRDGDDFFKVSGDELVALNNPKEYYGEFLYRMFPFSNGKALCVGSNNLFIYDFLATDDVDPMTVFKTDVDDEFKSTHMYMGCPIGDSAYAITTLTKGIYIINKNGKLIERINKDDGLQYNHVWITFLAQDNTLWCGLDKGISRVDFSSPIRFWNNLTGLDDLINSVYTLKDKLLIAGMTGAYKMQLNKNSGISKFEGLTYNVWNFNQIKETEHNTSKVIIATSKGIYTTDGETLSFLKYVNYNYYTFQSKIEPDILYATTLNSVIAFRFDNDTLVPFDTINFDGLAIKTIEIGNDLWITTFFKGVYKVNIKPNKDSLFLTQTVAKYDTLKGFNDNLQLKVFDINNEVYFTTPSGVYKYDPIADSMIKSTEFCEKLTKRSIESFYFQNDKYYFGSGYIFKFEKINGNYVQLDTLKYKPLKDKATNYVFADSLDNVYTCGTDGLYFIRNNDFKDYSKGFHTYIRKVAIKLDSVIFLGSYLNDSGQIVSVQPEKYIHTIKYKDNSVYFEFASPSFQSDSKVYYSYMLEKFDNDWSDWTTEAKNKYTNLHEGTYTFKVKAINVYEQESSIAEYTFKILPPWYRTAFAYIVYVIVLFLTIYFLVKFFTRRLKMQNIRLENLVQKRTAEISQQKEEILTKNEELMQQQEEIMAQRDELEAINKELEKLSVVASETDNSIFLLKPNGDFMWANQAFERIYGFTVAEFINKHKNIFDYLKNEELREAVKTTVFTEKKSYKYDSLVTTKNGSEVWLQTTFSPILGFNGMLRLVAAVESDISKLKEFENEIVLKNTEINKQNEVLSQKNELIESSIRYASTIQQSVLPPKEIFDKFFDNFIIFRAKDVVSGDFYWAVETEKYFFFAVVDCTGHGVPGAFMSLIGSRILTDIVLHNKIYSPAGILEELDKNIISSLRQYDTENNDGMDLILCRLDKIDKNDVNIVFASAKRPVIYSKNGEIKRDRGTSRGIGGHKVCAKEIKFEDFYLSLNYGDSIYLYSDGITDQNNYQRDKFKTSKLLNIIELINSYDVIHQKTFIEKELDDWQGDELQRDDISLLGIKFRS